MSKCHRNETVMIYLIIMYIFFIDLIASQVSVPSQTFYPVNLHVF